MKDILNRLFDHKHLDKEEARMMLINIAQGAYNETQIASLMTVFLMRNIAVDELLGFREALLEMCTPVNLNEYNPIDIVGTGGDGKNTFNISTCASFVVAAAGYKVVKHGNYGATSMSGASNVIENHGVRFSNDESMLRRSVEECGIAYLHAPLFNKALKVVAPVRSQLGVRSFFNMLGPLVNPAQPSYQLLGVYNLSLLRLYSYAYQHSNTRYAVVHSLDGYDEISLTSDFKVAMPSHEKIYTPASIGFDRCTEADLFGGNSQADATLIFDNVLKGGSTVAQRNSVIANAAFAIKLIEEDLSIDDCIAIATETIESGKAFNTLKHFIQLNS